jgi:putative membrane protein
MAEPRTARTLAAMMLGALAMVLGACSDRGAGTGDTGIGVTADTGAGAGLSDTGAMGATPAPGALSDANIVYILDAANRVDSAGGSIAATKGTNSEVREYGQMMARDHHQLRQQGQDLAKRLNVTPAPPAGDTAQAHFDKTMAMLNGAAKGRDFDKAYIDHEVGYHKVVLETATAAMSAAQNAELKNLIQKAAPVIQAHLDRAQAIQGRLQ